MNNMPGAPMGGTWHSKQNPEERQKIISIVVSTLKELQGSSFNEQAATKMAHDFEKYVFMKAPSRDDYLTAIKQKMHQMRGSLRNNQSQNTNQGQNQNQNHQKQQMNQGPSQFQGQAQASAQAARQAQVQQSQHQPPQSMGVGMNNDVNFYPQAQMPMRPSSSPQQNFQQAPQAMARGSQTQQTQQMQQGLQQKVGPNGPAQGQNGPGGQGMPRNSASQLTPQQAQQLTAMIKNAPIPAVFLNKIPNLPPNVNTWAKIFELAQQKMIPQTSLAAIKEVHQAHLNIVMHQQQQRIAQRRMSNMPQNANSAPAPSTDVQNNMNMGNMGSMGNMNNMNNMNMNNMNNMNMNGMGLNGMNNMNMNNMNMNRQSQGQMSMQNQRMQQQLQQQTAFKNNNANKTSGNQANMQLPMGMQRPPQNQQQQSSMMKPQQTMGNQASLGSNEATGQQQQAAPMKMPNFQITSQDIMNYQSEALAYLNRAQQEGKIPPNLDNEGKQNFIRKYVYHQKATAWKNEQLKKGNTVPASMAPQNQQRASQQSSMQMGNMSQGGFPPQQQLNQQQLPQQRQGQQHQQMGGVQQNMGQIQQSPMMGNPQQPPASNLMNQGTNQPMFSPVMQQNAPAQSSQGMANMAGQQNQARRPQGMPPITDEMKMKLRALYDEVARGDNLQSKNISMSLSDKDKLRFKEFVAKISSQYANVDSVLSYYYALTRDLGGTKKLIQMKFMTKNIIENYQKGIYLARPELLEKMTQHFQKYFDSVRKELLDRRQQQQQQQQQQPQATSQMSPAQQRPAMNQPSAQVVGQRPVSGMPMNQVDQRFMPQNMNQNNQQNFVSAGMGQMPMGQNLGPQQPSQTQTPQQIASQRTQQQVQQQFARNATHAQIAQGQPDWSKAVNAQRGPMNISPMPVPPSNTSPQVQPQPAPRAGAKQGKKASTSGASGRRKSVKAAGAMPTPGNSAPTPATLANAIKTPNSMPTPQVIQSNSNKGTPIDVSPNSDNKTNNMMAKEPIVGEVFGGSKNKADEKLDTRRELSKTNPEEFFFAALSNLLETDKGENVSDTKANIAEHTASPLSPNLAGWTCTVKPEAITSAFCQVDYIKDLTSLEVLDQCAKLVERDAKRKEEQLSSKKREREEPDDIDMLFDETETKKLRTGDYDRYMYEPVDFEEWNSWLTGLQSTKV